MRKLIYDGHVITKNVGLPRVSLGIHFDIGAEVNVIDQSFALANDLEPIEALLPSPQWLDGNTIYCYTAFLVSYELQDSWGYTKECRHVFYAISKDDNPPIVLGMPAMTDKQIKIDVAERTWRFGVVAKAFEVLPPQEFADTIAKESLVYALLVSDVDVNKGQRVYALKTDASRTEPDINTAPKLPDKLKEYEDVFSTEEASRLPSHKGRNHAIKTTAEPLFGSLYNLLNIELAELRRYLDNALAKGWIQHSTSPAGAPILFVPKKDGGLRLCVDYRGLNKVTVKNHHPLPLISKTLNYLTSAKVFTKLELKNAYHCIRIQKGNEWKTAFRTRYGYFENLVMPFGLTNASATFQAYINKLLTGLMDKFCVVYLDDILIYLDSQPEHLDHVKQVFERLRRFGLYASLKKCDFFTIKVKFLGFIVSTNEVAMDQRRVAAIQEWPKQKSYHEVQVFLGFVNFYWRFIHHYSQIAGPLTGLLKDSQKKIKLRPFEWLEAADQAF